MGPNILVISNRKEDRVLGKFIALTNAIQYQEAVALDEVERVLTRFPEAIVLWDGDEFGSDKSDMMELFSKKLRPSRNIALTSKTLDTYPGLLKCPFFGHQIVRRYADPAPALYARFTATLFRPHAEGLKSYFEPNTKIQRLAIGHSNHKSVAIDALQNTLTRRGIRGRVATLIAQCTDELLMNAIFDAPVHPTDRTRFRHSIARSTEFKLSEGEKVSMEMASCDEYMGICVTDGFGSINRAGVFNGLRSYFTKEASTGDGLSEAATGFGLQGILQSGVNLKILCQSSKKTEAMIFFPIAENFRAFRTSFRFFSMITGE